MIIFKAKSHEAFALKMVAELLCNNIRTGCFEVDERGIFLRMTDHHMRILIDLELYADNFTIYKFKAPKKMYLGINMSHFHRMLKSIKKKDSIKLFIDDQHPTDLGIQVIPKENNRTTTSYIKIQNIQNLIVPLPPTSSRHVIVSSSEYQKMCKDMGSIGPTIKVTAENFHIEFHCENGGILKRSVKFGEIDESDDESPSGNNEEPYCQDFVTEQLCRITKLAGLNTTMQIFPGKPMLLRSNVASLGKISIYIKSKEQLEMESDARDSDYDSD